MDSCGAENIQNSYFPLASLTNNPDYKHKKAIEMKVALQLLKIDLAIGISAKPALNKFFFFRIIFFYTGIFLEPEEETIKTNHRHLVVYFLCVLTFR